MYTAFRDELRVEVALHDPDWEQRLGAGADAVLALLRRFKPFSAHRVLRPFLESYRVVADALERRPAGAAFDEGDFLTACLKLGRQYQLQRRIHSGESVSKVIFGTALRLASNRGLLDQAEPNLQERWRAFAAEIRTALRRIDAVTALAASRRAGLID